MYTRVYACIHACRYICIYKYGLNVLNIEVKCNFNIYNSEIYIDFTAKSIKCITTKWLQCNNIIQNFCLATML